MLILHTWGTAATIQLLYFIREEKNARDTDSISYERSHSQ